MSKLSKYLILKKMRRVGRVVMQRIANPRTPVRFRYPPPLTKNTIKLRTIDFNGRIGKDIGTILMLSLRVPSNKAGPDKPLPTRYIGKTILE
jgi:hypothetical protein